MEKYLLLIDVKDFLNLRFAIEKETHNYADLCEKYPDTEYWMSRLHEFALTYNALDDIDLVTPSSLPYVLERLLKAIRP